jgi:hypothetical protein
MTKEISYLESSKNVELVEGEYVQKNFLKDLGYTIILTLPFAILYDFELFALLSVTVYSVIKNGEARRPRGMGIIAQE